MFYTWLFVPLLGGFSPVAAWALATPPQVALAEGSRVSWTSCGIGYDDHDCTRLELPLDHHNLSDPRTISVALTRYRAKDQKGRLGSIFMNPGGPGSSGTAFTYTGGPRMSKILDGRYDIVGFDPRGVNLTEPYTSCFPSMFDASVWERVTMGMGDNIPINFTDDVRSDMLRQHLRAQAESEALIRQCVDRTGEAAGYFGTEAVVNDIDMMSRMIDGDDSPINYWGLSYGSVISQYLISMVPPDRLGRIVIDGIIDAVDWSDYFDEWELRFGDHQYETLQYFASTCSTSVDCPLGPGSKHNLTATEILEKLDQKVEWLYGTRPVLGVPTPTVVNAATLRLPALLGLYKPSAWPQLASLLGSVFDDDYTSLARTQIPEACTNCTKKRDRSDFAGLFILCADVKPYDPEHPPPTPEQVVSKAIDSVTWSKDVAADACSIIQDYDSLRGKSHYAGTFDLPDGHLKTPMLILSQTYDPATPLKMAISTNKRLGTNSRLIQQVDGAGHGTLNQPSVCVARAVRDYFIRGQLPDEDLTLCEVDEDQRPWAHPITLDTLESKLALAAEEVAMVSAWRELGMVVGEEMSALVPHP